MVNLPYEQEYAMHCAGNLTKEKSYVNIVAYLLKARTVETENR
jgi:hypothetical protein